MRCGWFGAVSCTYWDGNAFEITQKGTERPQSLWVWDKEMAWAKVISESVFWGFVEAPKPQESLKPQVLPSEEAHIEREAGKGGHLQRGLRDLTAGGWLEREKNQEMLSSQGPDVSRHRCVKLWLSWTFPEAQLDILNWLWHLGRKVSLIRDLMFLQPFWRILEVRGPLVLKILNFPMRQDN